MISPSSGGETDVETTIISTQKSNKITSFFAKLVSWSSRENVSAASKEAKQNKKKRLNFFKNKTPEGHEEGKQKHSLLISYCFQLKMPRKYPSKKFKLVLGPCLEACT